MKAEQYVRNAAKKARQASRRLSTTTSGVKDAALNRISDNLRSGSDALRMANKADLDAGREAGLSGAMLDRLELTGERIEEMAQSVSGIAGLKDPVGSVIDGWTLPNGLRLRKVRTPLGVVCIIYESRPNVTADAAALCLKSGNAAVLRGGKEAINSNVAIYRLIKKALKDTGLPEGCIQLIETTDRAVVQPLLTADDCIDVVIPRGGKGLIKTVMETATIPVIKHYDGVCHSFVDESCNVETAVEICENAKCQRPGTCNAMETLLVHEKIAGRFLPLMKERFEERGVELRGCMETKRLLPDIKEAGEEDWGAEYLDLILAVRIVNGVDEAIEHINVHGSGHSEAIITSSLENAEKFQIAVDAAAVYVNASTRFTDGGQFGLGAEIGISTNKLHARGPMALEELTTYKWLINGEGQLRT